MNKTPCILALFLSLFISTSVGEPDSKSTQEPQTNEIEAKSVEYIHREMTIDDQKYNWTIIIPSSAQEGGPGILFLHGRGQGGDDGESHIAHGLPIAVEKNPELWPFVIIVPQKTDAADWEFHEPAVMKMLDEAIKDEFVDKDKIAITGLSQGGHAALVFPSMHPKRFVASAPVCGYAQVAFGQDGNPTPFPTMSDYQETMKEIASNIKDIPIWLFHGDKDTVVPVISSRMMDQTLLAFGADVEYTEFPGVDHNAWDPAYKMKELAEWFSEFLHE